MHDKVIQALREAYGLQPEQVDDRLQDGDGGRVFGLLIVKGAPEFARDSIGLRSRKFWDTLRTLPGPGVVNAGVVLLRTDEEAAAEGY